MPKLEDFNFHLPKELIAQNPSDKRDHSSLLITSNTSGEENKVIPFYDIIDHFKSDDLIVFNDSRVINAELSIVRDGQKTITINLNRPIDKNKWIGFARPSKKLNEGDKFYFDNHAIIISNKLDYGEIEIEFELNAITIFDFLDIYGKLPLPQYIKREEENSIDHERYQNIYSKPKGSVAAPTAGLHFTPELLSKIKEKKIETTFVTLHVGAGTFLPVKTQEIKEHKMHVEWCEVSNKSAEIINKAKREGRRIILVGTTTMRTIESCSKDGIVYAGTKETDIFITPGYSFQIADILITNFHLPKSTLFMLVSAFSGQKEMKELYQYAINKKMRFFSYGDSMLLYKKEK